MKMTLSKKQKWLRLHILLVLGKTMYELGHIVRSCCSHNLISQALRGLTGETATGVADVEIVRRARKENLGLLRQGDIARQELLCLVRKHSAVVASQRRVVGVIDAVDQAKKLQRDRDIHVLELLLLLLLNYLNSLLLLLLLWGFLELLKLKLAWVAGHSSVAAVVVADIMLTI